MFAQPVAGALDFDHDSVVKQAVEERGRDQVIAEYCAPVAEAAVGGDDHGAVLVACVDQLEEQVGAARFRCRADRKRGGRVPPTPLARKTDVPLEEPGTTTLRLIANESRCRQTPATCFVEPYISAGCYTEGHVESQ